MFTVSPFFSFFFFSDVLVFGKSSWPGARKARAEGLLLYESPLWLAGRPQRNAAHQQLIKSRAGVRCTQAIAAPFSPLFGD